MDITNLLNNKSIKPIAKRTEISEAIRIGAISIREIKSLSEILDDKKLALIFEAMESVTAMNPELAYLDWLLFTQEFITSESNSLKREASRIAGNIAFRFPDDLEVAIRKLLENAGNESTVVRWSSAYALGRIIAIPKYAESELFDVVSDLYEREKDNGIRNRYLSGLKKARNDRERNRKPH